MQELFPKLRTGKYPDLPDELTSMRIRANAGTLRMQLEMAGQMDFLDFPSHQGIVDGTLPLCI